MVQIFKALSEDSRLRILSLLIGNELCVCEIEEILGMTQSNTSRHLTVLKNCGVLESNKKAQWSYYSVSPYFQENHKELWDYLQIKLKQLDTYQSDMKKYKKCIDNNLCAYKKEGEKH